jgi:hypothetical protein
VRETWDRLVPIGVPIVSVPIPVVPVAPVLRPLFAAVIRPSLAPSVVVGIDAADGNAEGAHGKCQAEKTLFHVGPPRVKVARGLEADLTATDCEGFLGFLRNGPTEPGTFNGLPGVTGHLLGQPISNILI